MTFPHESLPQFIVNNTHQSLITRLEWLTLHPQSILYLGIDSNPLLLQIQGLYPNARLNTLNPPNDQPLHLPNSPLPFQDHSVDLLLAQGLFPWSQNFGPLLAEWSRVLAPEGVLLFITHGTNTLMELRNSWITPLPNYLPDLPTLGDALLTAQFVDPVVDLDHFELHCSQVKDLQRLLKKIKAIRLITPATHLAGKQALQHLYENYEHYRLPNGQLPITVDILYGYARGQSSSRFKIISE